MELEKVHISQFYPCSKVTLGSELFYICELGKYLKGNNKCLSIDGVILDNILLKSRFWDYMRIAVSNGWLVDVGIDKYILEITIQNPVDLNKVKNIYITEEEVEFDRVDSNKRADDLMYAWSTPEKVQACFTSKTDEVWFWSLKGTSFETEQINSRSLNSVLPSQSWVSLTAYVAVHRLIFGFPRKFAIEFNSGVVANKQLTVVDIMLLDKQTDALNGWFFMRLDTSVSDDLQSGYEAWWYKGFEQGLLRREYTAEEKSNYFKQLGFQVGDILLLYERKISQKNNYVKSIENMHFALVESASSSTLGLNIINNKKTKMGYEKWYSKLTMAVKQMYMGSTSYKELRTTVRGYSWRDIGVDYMMRTEQFFVTQLQMDDYVQMWVTDGKRQDNLELPEKDIILWILKDYEIKFNEDRFLELYYKENEVPLYYRYMSGESLEEYRVVEND